MNSHATTHAPFDARPAEAPPCWQQDFVKMLPKIQDHASHRFRHLSGDRCEEAVQEVVGNCYQAYARLVEQGRTETATWSSLAKYAVAQVRAGRRVGAAANVKDGSSQYCQQRKCVSICSLDRWDDQDQEWTQMVVEDRHATPADPAAFRLDLREFLRSLPRRNRQIALLLAKSHSTSWIAKKFHISAARVSQLRRELCEAWRRFQGEVYAEELPAAVTDATLDLEAAFLARQADRKAELMKKVVGRLSGSVRHRHR